MFRRFGILLDNGEESERLFNLNHIITIGIDSRGRTFIRVIGGFTRTDKQFHDYFSSVEYKHLADALDGII